VIAFYLSTEHREEKMDGCPIVALGSDAARQGSDVKASFEAGIKAHLEILGRLIAETNDEEPKGKAMSILSTMVGALMLSRVVNDPDLAQAFLDAATEQVREGVRRGRVDRQTLRLGRKKASNKTSNKASNMKMKPSI
jgi:TetR/AcrR family transcriptional repressor of nem operon